MPLKINPEDIVWDAEVVDGGVIDANKIIWDKSPSNFNEVTTPNLGGGQFISGPVGLMPKPVDIPGMASSFINGLAFGQPRAILENPNLTAFSGITGANFAQGANIPNNLNALLELATGGKVPNVTPQVFRPSGLERLIPEAVTPQGKIASTLLELGGGVLSGEAVFNHPPIVKKISAKAQNLFNSGKNLRSVEGEIASIPERNLNLRNEMKSIRAGKVENMKTITRDFQIKNKKLGEDLQKEALFQSESNKANLRKLFKSISDTYKNGINQAEDALQAKGIQINSTDYLDSVVNKTIQDLTAKGLPPDTPAFKQIEELAYQMKPKSVAPEIDPSGIMPVKESVIESSKSLSLKDLRDFKTSVYDTLSAGLKRGTEYLDTNDYIANTFLRNHAEFIAKNSPELAQLNREFAPLAEARRWAMRSFKPYSEAEIERGASILRRIASSEKPNQTDLNYLKRLEEGSGRFKGSGDLRGGTTQTGKGMFDLKKSFNLAKQNLIDATDFKIYQVESRMARMQKLGIDLKFERQRLQDLNNIRRFIIGATILTGAGAVNPTARKLISKAIGA